MLTAECSFLSFKIISLKKSYLPEIAEQGISDPTVTEAVQKVLVALDSYASLGPLIKSTLRDLIFFKAKEIEDSKSWKNFNDLKNVIMYQEIIPVSSMNFYQYLSVAKEFNSVREVSPFSFSYTLQESALKDYMNLPEEEFESFVSKFFVRKDIIKGFNKGKISVLYLRSDLTEDDIVLFNSYKPNLYEEVTNLLKTTEHYVYKPSDFTLRSKLNIKDVLFAFFSGIEYKSIGLTFIPTHTHPFGLDDKVLEDNLLNPEEFKKQGHFHSSDDLNAFARMGRVAPLLTVSGLTVFDPNLRRNEVANEELYLSRVNRRNQIREIAMVLKNNLTETNVGFNNSAAARVLDILNNPDVLDKDKILMIVDYSKSIGVTAGFIRGLEGTTADLAEAKSLLGLSNDTYREILAFNQGYYLFFVSNARIRALNAQTNGQLAEMSVEDGIRFISLTGRYFRQKMELEYGVDCITAYPLKNEDKTKLRLLYKDLLSSTSLQEAEDRANKVEAFITNVPFPAFAFPDFPASVI